jgi:uncharacterized protein
MSVGLSQKFNVLQQSPHDLQAIPEAPTPAEEGTVRWVASRFTVRAATEDGKLVLWNTYNGNMGVIEAELRPAVEALLTKKGFEARPRGVVKYLCDRGFLIKEGTDEYRRIQLGFGQEHYRTDRLELILLASEDCNFRCEYCYEDFARGTMQPWVRTGIRRLVEKRLAGLRALKVHWFGGEPLYGFAAIEELAPFFLRTAKTRQLQFYSDMTTNGYLLSPEVADKLLSWQIRRYQVTIDGTPEDHDRSRPGRNGESTFWTIFGNLKALHRRTDTFQVELRVNFDQKNHAQVGEFLEMVKGELGGDPRFRLLFRAVGRWGGPNDESLSVCGVDESRRVSFELREEARKRGLKVVGDIHSVKGMGAQVCYAARPYNFIVGAGGKLMKCTIDLDKQDRNVVGRIQEDGELELDVDKLALWTEPAFETDGKCQKCVVLPACQGISCPQVRFDTGNSPCIPLRTTYKAELRGVAQSVAAKSPAAPAGRGKE